MVRCGVLPTLLHLPTALIALAAAPPPEKAPLPPPPPPPWLQLAEQVTPPPTVPTPPMANAVEPGAPSPPRPPAAAPAPPRPQVAVPVAPLPPQPSTAIEAPPPPQAAAPGDAAQPPSASSEQAAPSRPPQQDVPQAAERKIREYRYRTRIIKSMILPLIFSIMSVLMLNSYVTVFDPYFSFDFELIATGFLIGAVVMSGFVMANMRIAKKEGSYVARQRYGVLIILAFLVPYLYLILFVAPAQAWRFSIGYFLSAVLTPIVVMAYESLSDGKFFIQEEEVDDRLTRTLVFRS